MELPGIGEPETLRARTRELPDPEAGQALVRVEASGVSFAEQQMRLGNTTTSRSSHSSPDTTWSGWSSSSPATMRPEEISPASESGGEWPP